jgi:hypothetical protein
VSFPSVRVAGVERGPFAAFVVVGSPLLVGSCPRPRGAGGWE